MGELHDWWHLKFVCVALEIRVAGGKEKAEAVFAKIGGRAPGVHLPAISWRVGVTGRADDARSQCAARDVAAVKGVACKAQDAASGWVS